MTAELASSKRSLRRGGVPVGDALSRLPSGNRRRLSVETCGSVVEVSCQPCTISFFRMMDFLLEIGTEVFTEETFLREMNRNNPF